MGYLFLILPLKSSGSGSDSSSRQRLTARTDKPVFSCIADTFDAGLLQLRNGHSGESNRVTEQSLSQITCSWEERQTCTSAQFNLHIQLINGHVKGNEESSVSKDCIAMKRTNSSRPYPTRGQTRAIISSAFNQPADSFSTPVSQAFRPYSNTSVAGYRQHEMEKSNPKKKQKGAKLPTMIDTATSNTSSELTIPSNSKKSAHINTITGYMKPRNPVAIEDCTTSTGINTTLIKKPEIDPQQKLNTSSNVISCPNQMPVTDGTLLELQSSLNSLNSVPTQLEVDKQPRPGIQTVEKTPTPDLDSNSVLHNSGTSTSADVENTASRNQDDLTMSLAVANALCLLNNPNPADLAAQRATTSTNLTPLLPSSGSLTVEIVEKNTEILIDYNGRPEDQNATWYQSEGDTQEFLTASDGRRESISEQDTDASGGSEGLSGSESENTDQIHPTPATIKTKSRLRKGKTNSNRNEELQGKETTKTPSLDLIFQTMLQHKEEDRIHNEKVMLANKEMKDAIDKLTDSCFKMTNRLDELETRTNTIENDLAGTTSQIVSHEERLTDLHWKAEEAENRQRRNNLRILGVPEGREGQDPRAFVVSMLRKAFPELSNWDIDKEVQRAHRFPFQIKNSAHSGKPRALLIFIGNFLLRQEIYYKARPRTPRSADDISFFVTSDFCHKTVERRWRLRQCIKLFQDKGYQAFLLEPAKLKVIKDGKVSFFLSEIKAQAFLHLNTTENT